MSFYFFWRQLVVIFGKPLLECNLRAGPVLVSCPCCSFFFLRAGGYDEGGGAEKCLIARDLSRLQIQMVVHFSSTAPATMDAELVRAELEAEAKRRQALMRGFHKTYTEAHGFGFAQQGGLAY